MSTAILSLPFTLKPTRHRNRSPNSALWPPSPLLSVSSIHGFKKPAISFSSANSNSNATFAYVTGPASDPIATDPDPKLDGASDSDSDSQVRVLRVLNWGLLWRLLRKDNLRIVASFLTLISCTTCTLSMPFFSGRHHFWTFFPSGRHQLYPLRIAINVSGKLNLKFTHKSTYMLYKI